MQWLLALLPPEPSNSLYSMGIECSGLPRPVPKAPLQQRNWHFCTDSSRIYFILLYCTTQIPPESTVCYCTVQHRFRQNCTVKYFRKGLLFSTVFYCILLYSAVFGQNLPYCTAETRPDLMAELRLLMTYRGQETLLYETRINRPGVTGAVILYDVTLGWFSLQVAVSVCSGCVCPLCKQPELGEL